MALGKLPDSGLDGLDGEEEAIFAEINITPLTDVFLVMLIVFMVAAAAALQEKKQELERVQDEVVAEQRSGLKVNLPAGATQELDPTASSLVVSILSSGEIYVNDTAVDEGQLDNIFRSAFTRDKNTQVVLKADSGVHHGRVVGVMERAKRTGLTRLAIATSGG